MRNWVGGGNKAAKGLREYHRRGQGRLLLTKHPEEGRGARCSFREGGVVAKERPGHQPAAA